AGHIAQRGQALTPGVVHGLEVSWVGPAVARPPDEVRLLIESGQGLAVGGEDVMLVRRVECWLQDLPVAAPPDWLLPVDTDVVPTGEAAVPGTLHPRVVPDDKRLVDVRASAGDRMPRVGVLVLQPVTADRSRFDPNDPCDLCPCGEGEGEGSDSNVASFQDWRITDGARLLWYPWPQEWKPLPGTALRLRNALANRIFEAEAELAHGEALPWEAWGVPIALVAVDASWKPLWTDRAAVVRQGGRAREARLQLAPGAGMQLAANSRLPALWQARIEQFAEQIAESGDPLPPPQVLSDPFLQLPPCGLMPKSALDLGNFRSPFFPPIFELDAVPVPMEQLDLAMRESAPLTAFDMSSPERLRLLVPVTQASWEPRLLFKDAVDAEFQQTLDGFLLTRSRVLGLRQGLRWKEALLLHAIDGVAPSVPAFSDDLQALEPESLSPWGEPPAGGGHRSALLAGIHQHYFDGANPGLAVKADDALYAWVCLDPDNPPRTVMLQWHTADGWEHRAYWGENLIPWGTAAAGPSHFPAGPLPTAGQWLLLSVAADKVGLAGQTIDGMGFTLYDGRAAYGLAGTRNGNAQVKWFCNVLPAGVSLQGNEGWDFLTANDLWAPFELRYGVVPSLAEPVDAAASPDALLRTPVGGFNVTYPLATGWRGHRVPLDGAPPGPLRLQLSGNEAIGGKLFCSVYLDEMTPPSAIWVSISLSVFGDEMSFWDQNAFWGENHLDELAKVAPELGANQTPALRAGGLPRSSRWVQIEIPLPAERESLAIYEVRFMAYGGALAISDLTFGRPTAPAVAGEPWVLKPELAWPRRRADNSLHAPFSKVLSKDEISLKTGEGVLTPTNASRIGTAPVYDDLAGHAQMSRLSQHERSQLQLRGLNRFADYLRERIDRTDDITDFGFAHMQVDMHRMRQLMMSTTDASRLAISPALAAIAKSDSALTVQSQIKEYLTKVKVGPLTRSASVAEVAVPRALTVKASFSAVASSVQAVKASSLAMLIQPPRAPLNIVYANPVVGLSPIRTVAIADRLKQP
ncbi:MAG: hypothetical protein JWQ41_1356, partial [Variovorax sp.]|nr:hypothetical protein [Variovorax sp.]